MERRIFLSHRHADREIANVIRRHLELWNFPPESIFQSSQPGQGALVGNPLSEEIETALDEAKVVVLLYTLADHDWSYCMWECGVATDPKKQGDTRIVVFQCSALDAPRVYKSHLLVKITQPSILDFTTQLYRKADFFPGESAYGPTVREETLREKSVALYDDLEAVIPAGTEENFPRWDQLTLQLMPIVAEQIRGMGDESKVLDRIENESQIVDAFGNALRHFGYENMESDLTLAKLISRWRDKIGNEPDVNDDWIQELAREMRRAIQNAPANPQWSKLRSAFVRDWDFFPVINTYRALGDGTLEFKVNLYQAQ